MHGKKILITGSTGFIGNHLVAYLIRCYPSCIISGVCRGKAKVLPNYNIYSANLLKQDEITDVINHTQPDYIFHLAGLVFSYDWDALYNGNVTSTLNLLEAIKRVNIKPHVVIAGSSAEYGVISPESLPVTEIYPAMPQTPYGLTKLWQTSVAKYYQSEDFSITIARIFNVIGSHISQQLTIGDLFSQINRVLHKKQIPQISVGNLHLKRDFLDIDDICFGLASIVTQGQPGNIYNVCSGSSVSLKEILDLSIAVSGISVDIVSDDNKPQNSYIEDIYGCNAKIKKDTSWELTVSLSESIRKALNVF